MTSTGAGGGGAMQQKFGGLRRRLDQLGYRQPLGIESFPLVERLFLDLIHTTDSLKKAKLGAGASGALGDGAVSTAAAAGHQVEAYKSDNAKLIKENNELHQQLIHIKEDSEFAIKELKSSLRKFEHENADLKFLNNQYVHRMRSLEQESKQKTERILQLQEKNFNAVVQTPGGKKKNIPFRRQRMEVDCTVPSSGVVHSANGSVVATSDPYVADLLKVADESIARLNEDLRILREEKAGTEAKIGNLRKQVDLRDAEVDRLTRMLEGGRPFDVVALEARSRQSERMLSHLNIQVDYLQQKNHELQGQLDRLTSRAESSSAVDARNYELAKELKDIDRTAQRLRRENDKVSHVTDFEIDQNKTELERTKFQLEKMDLLMNQLKGEKEQRQTEIEVIARELDSEREEKKRLMSLIHRVQEDKQRLGEKISQLTVSERELVLEIDRLRRQQKNVLSHKQHSKVASDEASDAVVRDVEEERDYWKNEVQVLQEILNSKLSDSVSSAQSKCSSSSVEDKNETKEISELRRERDELRRMLDTFERRVTEIQTNIKVLTLERDSATAKVAEMKEQLMQARRDVAQSPKSAKTSLASQAVLRRVENERDEALLSCRNLTVERDSLRERLKIAVDANLVERAKLEQTIEDLEAALSTAESNQKNAEERQNLSQKHLEALEERLRENMTEAANARDETAQHKTTASQMRLLAEQSEHSAKDFRAQLARKDADLHSADERIHSLTDQLNALRQTSVSDQDEIAKLRLTISKLDQEKDALQMMIDEKTEQEVKRTDAITNKEQFINDLQNRIIQMESSVSHLRDELMSKEREVLSLRRQLDNANDELTEAGRSRELLLRDGRRLQGDLNTMTQENQSLNQDLEETLQEKERLKEQAQEYLMEVKRCEELLSSKERERTEILEQYRALSQETERFETQFHHLESEGSSLKLEILSRDGELRRTRDKLDKAERENQEHVASMRAYEIQLSNMAKSVATLEEALRHLEEEKRSLSVDVSALRDLCRQLESNKETLQRQLMTKSLDQEKLQSLLDDVKHETEMLRSQVTTERSTKQGLEGLLQENRNKEWHVQLTIQDKDAEIQLLKDQLQMNNSKIECQTRELNQYRTTAIETESDLERLKRQLISERFERERVVQELRRNGLCLPGESGRLGPISPNSSKAKPSAQPSASETIATDEVKLSDLT